MHEELEELRDLFYKFIKEGMPVNQHGERIGYRCLVSEKDRLRIYELVQKEEVKAWKEMEIKRKSAKAPEAEKAAASKGKSTESKKK